MIPDNALTQWARLAMDSFAQSGVRDVIISPGSRSTPFAWAALQHAGLRCHSVIDERSAGFFALGHAKLTRTPCLLLCTSGSAGANYFPALTEACFAHVPLIVFTADRPIELQHCRAPQTIDQVKLFGSYCREYFELGLPTASPVSLRALQRLIAQAVLTARFPKPGPVHVNARADKPLEPVSANTNAALDLEKAVTELIQAGPPRAYAPVLQPPEAGIEWLTRRCQKAERGLIVCGREVEPYARETFFELSARTGFPLLVDAASGLRFTAPAEESRAILCPSYEAVLRCVPHCLPDFVLHFGEPLASKGYEELSLQAPRAEKHIIASQAWPDPDSFARSLIVAPPNLVAEQLLTKLPAFENLTPDLAQARSSFAERWREAERRVRAYLEDASLSEIALSAQANPTQTKTQSPLRDAGAPQATPVGQPASKPALCELDAVRTTVARLPSGSVLAIGNSLLIREVDAFCPELRQDLRVWVQRGANGIDGLLSGAAGAAQASERPTALLIGDVSFAHDVGGLACARKLKTPFVIVVVDNAGGRIFDQLPFGSAKATSAETFAYWRTPPELGFQELAKAYACAFEAVSSSTALKSALARAFERAGCSIVVAKVAPQSAQIHASRIFEAVRQSLEASESPLGASK